MIFCTNCLGTMIPIKHSQKTKQDIMGGNNFLEFSDIEWPTFLLLTDELLDLFPKWGGANFHSKPAELGTSEQAPIT